MMPKINQNTNEISSTLLYNIHTKSMYLYYKKYYPISYTELKLTTCYSNKKIIDIIRNEIYNI